LKYLLLLANADGVGTARELIVRNLRAFPGEEGISVHFRPVRGDALFHSAKAGSGVAYRVLLAEGIVRSQVWVEYELGGSPINVAGRSGDLVFALALLTSAWKRTAGEYAALAATGVLESDEALVATEPAPAVTGVDHLEAKLAAAVDALAGERAAVVFYPAADRKRVEAWCATADVPGHVQILPVATLDDALSALGIQLEKVYLGNPYRGLEYFDYVHRSLFFGRDGEIRELTAQLLRREQAGAPGVLVEGASGSGKSSLLRAGILPALLNPGSRSQELERALSDRPVPDSIRRAIWSPALVPAGADEAAVARSIYRVWREVAQLAEPAFVAPETLEALRRLWHVSWPKDRRFVWLVDQLDELFNLGLDESVIASFGNFLLDLQRDGAWTLACMRIEAVPHLKRYSSLREVFGANEGQYYLPGLGATALDEVIRRPAKAAGLTFGVDSRGQRLDQALREDAYRDHEHTLPLLQLTLHELYLRRCGRELTYAEYERLGGLTGAVATIASTALKQGLQATNSAAPRLFRALITIDDSGSAKRRYALLSEFAEVPEQAQLLAALVNARLCVSTQQEGRPVVALAHESVLRTWPDLVDWLREESGLLQLRELAEHDARLWQQRARSDAWLAAPSRLAALERLEEAGVRVSELAGEFIQRSRTRMRRIVRLKRAGISAIVLLAIATSLTGLIAVSKQHEAQYEAARAVRARNQATLEAATARATAAFLAAIFNAPTPERSLGERITARELLDEGARRLRTGLVAAPEIRARLTEQIGNAYRELGEYDRAAPLLQSAVAQYQALPQAPITDRAEAYTALGQLYLDTDTWPSAAEALVRAMALEAKIPPELRSALPQIVYAHVEAHMANYPAAKAALDQARQLLQQHNQAADQEDYLLLMGYSQLYLDQGELRSARRFGLEALRAQARILGPEDPSAIDPAFRLSDVYLASDDAAQAEKYDRRAMMLAKKLYGANNPVYAKMLEACATDFHYLGNNRQAERLFRAALRIPPEILGAQLSGQAYLNLGSTLTFEGRWREGLALTRRALGILESSEGRDSPDAAFALAAEARILTHLGEPAAAIPLAQRALQISQRPDHSDRVATVWEWMQLGRAEAALGRFPAAAAALHQATAVYQSLYGDTGKPLAGMLVSYAGALERAGRFSAARVELARAAQIRNRKAAMRAPKLDLRSN
jgi:Novel STAND NTPase 1/Tetratricopeptide repeat